MHGLKSLGYEMCQKWAQVFLGSLLPEGNTENSSAQSKYSKMREHKETQHFVDAKQVCVSFSWRK